VATYNKSASLKKKEKKVVHFHFFPVLEFDDPIFDDLGHPVRMPYGGLP